MIQSLVTTTPVYLPTHPSKALSQHQDYDAMKWHGRWAESTVEERKLWPSSDLISGSRSTRSSIATPHGVADFSKDDMFHRKSLFALFVGYREAAFCSTSTPAHVCVDISQPWTLLSLHLLLLVCGMKHAESSYSVPQYELQHNRPFISQSFMLLPI